jgi:hypothetical protein
VSVVQHNGGDAFAATRSPVISFPAAPTPGNVIVAAFITTTAMDPTTPAGWTRITDQASGTLYDSWLGYRIVQAGDGASLTLTNLFAATESGGVAAVELSGRHATLPIGVTQGADWQTQDESVSVTVHELTAAFTPPEDNCDLVHFYLSEQTGLAGGAGEAGWAEQVDAQLTAVYVYAQTLAQGTAAAVTPAVTTGSARGRQFAVAVRPAAGGVTHAGAFAIPLAFGIDVAGTPTKHGAFELPLAFGIDVAGTPTKHGAFELPLAFGISTAGTVYRRGAFALELAFGLDVAGRAIPLHRGAFAIPLTFGISTAGRIPLPMIERVAIGGVDVDLADVFAGVTIRHGRQSVDDGPLASSATLSLVNVTREYGSEFRVGAELLVELVGGIPRFVGRITDAELDGDEGTLAIVAIGPLAAISTRPVGAVDWPAEPWSDRVERVFTEAGELATLELVVGADDPQLAARPADPSTLGAMLEELAETGAAAIANTPAGTVLVQAITARKLGALEPLEPLFVELDLPFSQADDVTNELTVEWAGGEVTVEDLASIAAYDRRSESIETTLADEDDADHRARLELRRRAWPAWALEELNYLRLKLELAIGDRVLVEELPAAAPKASIVGVLEGWEDRVIADDGELEWTMKLNLSPAILSGAGVSWNEVDPTISWAEASTNWIETEELLA